MTTLAEERAATGAGIRSSRAGTAAAGRQASAEAIRSGRAGTSQDDRRALGASLERQRRGSTLKQDLNALETLPRGNQTLAPRQATGGRPETTGQGVWDPNKIPASSGGGVASPLTEPDVNERTWWPFGLASSDGLIVLPAIKELKLQDANDAAVVVQLADPAGVTP